MALGTHFSISLLNATNESSFYYNELINYCQNSLSCSPGDKSIFTWNANLTVLTRKTGHAFTQVSRAIYDACSSWLARRQCTNRQDFTVVSNAQGLGWALTVISILPVTTCTTISARTSTAFYHRLNLAIISNPRSDTRALSCLPVTCSTIHALRCIARRFHLFTVRASVTRCALTVRTTGPRLTGATILTFNICTTRWSTFNAYKWT